MSTTLEHTASARSLPLLPAPPAGPVLVASDGGPASDPAFRAAHLLAVAGDVAVEVVSAVDPVAPPLGAPEMMVPLLEAQREQEALRLERVVAQTARTTDASSAWVAHVASGRAMDVVASVARERRARLVVVGGGQHRLVDRLLGAESALKIARACDAPTLVVPPQLTRLPRVAIVAVDFSAACIRAAAAARPLLREAECVFLVHVKPLVRVDLPGEVWAGLERGYGEALRAAFARVTEALALPGDVQCTTVELRGAAARELLHFATTSSAELVVAGHTHRSRLERLIGGSVATQLLRGVSCALLLAPDAPPDTAHGTGRAAVRSDVPRDDRPRWCTELLAYGRRNAGRLVTLQVLDASLGAELEARRYPLAWIRHDWQDDSVEIGLGDPVHGRAHLTHVVHGPGVVAMLDDSAPDCLRITRPDGRTILRLDG